MGYSILGLFMLAAQWYNSGLTLVERGRQVRKDNEMLAISWLPDPPKSARYVPSDAVVVRPMDLARSYHDSKRAADYAYNEQTITLCVRGYVVRDRAIHWHLGDQNIPALVVMELAEGEKIPATALNRTLWVTGRCEGRMDDGVKRDYDYPFHVRVTACRAVLE